jgi:hypothetical protein
MHRRQAFHRRLWMVFDGGQWRLDPVCAGAEGAQVFKGWVWRMLGLNQAGFLDGFWSMLVRIQVSSLEWRLPLLTRRKDYNNTARLKDLMTAPPMSAERHAAINRKRIEERRMLEDLRQQKAERNDLF